MKEIHVILVISIIFSIIGLVIVLASTNSTEFNFYKSEISIDGKKITEKLYFKPDKSYHTLYRNFQSSIYFNKSYLGKESIGVLDVKCQSGNAYVYSSSGAQCIMFKETPQQTSCPLYTEKGEYGCTFGNQYGFLKGEEYWVEATYELSPDTIFIVNEQTYIKFEAYSEKKHVSLNTKNFIVSGPNIKENSYSSLEDVIIYIPYNGTIPGAKVIWLDKFEFDSDFFERLQLYFLVLLPILITFFVWYFFGREKTYADIPPELSMYPHKRRPWQVAAYFQPPFNVMDKNFYSSMLINFYNKKVIDIKLKEKEVWVKINDYSGDLDIIEKNFLAIILGLFSENPLRSLKEKTDSWTKAIHSFGRSIKKGLFGDQRKNYIDGDYINLKKAFRSSANRSYMQVAAKLLKDEVKKEGKKYIDTKGSVLISTLVIVLYFVFYFFSGLVVNPYILFLFFFFFIFLLFANAKSALFIRFKESYYKEYQHWQAYRKFLKNSFSIKHHGYKGIVLWDEILVYATSLGVSKKVLKQLKEARIIDEKIYFIYIGVYASANSFSVSSGSAGGGAGGGGVGGGGGGGR